MPTSERAILEIHERTIRKEKEGNNTMQQLRTKRKRQVHARTRLSQVIHGYITNHKSYAIQRCPQSTRLDKTSDIKYSLSRLFSPIFCVIHTFLITRLFSATFGQECSLSPIHTRVFSFFHQDSFLRAFPCS